MTTFAELRQRTPIAERRCQRCTSLDVAGGVMVVVKENGTSRGKGQWVAHETAILCETCASDIYVQLRTSLRDAAPRPPGVAPSRRDDHRPVRPDDAKTPVMPGIYERIRANGDKSYQARSLDGLNYATFPTVEEALNWRLSTANGAVA